MHYNYASRDNEELRIRHVQTGLQRGFFSIVPIIFLPSFRRSSVIS